MELLRIAGVFGVAKHGMIDALQFLSRVSIKFENGNGICAALLAASGSVQRVFRSYRPEASKVVIAHPELAFGKRAGVDLRIGRRGDLHD